MKKLLVVFVAMMLVAGFSAISHAALDGSSHDFADETWMTAGSAGGGGELCGACHTPHFPPSDAGSVGVLWNHAVGASSDYTLYAGATSLGDRSLACLGCHDGIIGVDDFGGGSGSTSIGTTWDVARDLTDDHPVGVDGSSYSPTTAKLYSNQVECASCHDPHETGNGKFLRLANGVGSALCQDCHAK